MFLLSLSEATLADHSLLSHGAILRPHSCLSLVNLFSHLFSIPRSPPPPLWTCSPSIFLLGYCCASHVAMVFRLPLLTPILDSTTLNQVSLQGCSQTISASDTTPMIQQLPRSQRRWQQTRQFQSLNSIAATRALTAIICYAQKQKKRRTVWESTLIYTALFRNYQAGLQRLRVYYLRTVGPHSLRSSGSASLFLVRRVLSLR
jgi:hypothetical protein